MSNTIRSCSQSCLKNRRAASSPIAAPALCRISAMERSPSIAVSTCSWAASMKSTRSGYVWLGLMRTAAARRAILDGQRPGKPDRDETAPVAALECGGLGLALATVTVSDEAVPIHCSAQKLHRCMLDGRGKRRKPSVMRRAVDRPALRKVGRLLVPAPELEAAPLEPVVNLRHGIGAILWVQQRIGERVGSCKVLRPLHDAGDRMVDWQRLNRLAEIAQVLVPDADPEQPAIVLHHVDARAPVRRVDHDVHCAIPRKDIAQRP